MKRESGDATLRRVDRAADRATSARRWYWDALAAGAFLLQALVLARVTRGLPALALALFAVNLGLAWRFFRLARRGFLDIWSRSRQ